MGRDCPPGCRYGTTELGPDASGHGAWQLPRVPRRRRAARSRLAGQVASGTAGDRFPWPDYRGRGAPGDTQAARDFLIENTSYRKETTADANATFRARAR